MCPPRVGEIVEAKLISRGKGLMFFDLGNKGIGVVYGKEFLQARESLKNLRIDEAVFAKVVNLETDEGYRELSLAEANQELNWEDLAKAKEKGEAIEVQIKSANKGGLICPIKGIPGFLPASQLSPENYPKVEGAEPAKIAQELQKLVGKKIRVKIFDLNPAEKKLILSEKSAKKDKIEEELTNYQVGDVVEGEISGVTNFGAFIKFGKNLEGLIYAAEINASKETRDPARILKIGEKLNIRISEINNGRVYFSLKDVSQEKQAEEKTKAPQEEKEKPAAD